MTKKHFLILLILIGSAIGIGAKYGDDYHLSSANITPKVLKYIQQNYIDQDRIKPAKMLKGALEQIQKSAAEILVTFDADDRFTITIDKAVKKFNPEHISTLDDLWEALKNIYLFIELNYHGTIEPNDLEYLAIDGMLNVLDPHSSMLTPKIYNEFKIGTKGKFGGIGIVIGSKEGELTVIAPIEGTPAWRAGIKAGDKIVQIGEESTINMSLTEAVELLRGDIGTDVTISVNRKGKTQPFNVTLKRAIINIDSIQSAVMPVGNKSVGYIKIKNFQENTDKEFSKQLAKLKQSPNFSGLILDMRNNPGGLLNQAVEIADKFLSSGIIVSTRGAGERFIEQEPAKEEGTEPLYPLAVLVNEGSASASEIVAGTLQNYKRAIVIGNQTFGKGSVQTVFDLKDGSALKLTVAEYLTAGKNSIQSIGVTPDIKLVPAVIDKEKMDLIEDEHESETSLEGHLNQDESIKKGESAYKLSFLEKAEEENEDEKSRREYSNKIDFSKDFATMLAGRLIAGAQNSGDPFAGIASAVNEENKKQQVEIADSLSKLNVSWSECKLRGKPLLQVSFAMNKNGETVEK
ncbi:MAG: PDZ domain-containing protein [Deltaproteobacteria bacterium]|nr:PDZ domain-containing protein [Deltaproteobacteria bacterium]